MFKFLRLLAAAVLLAAVIAAAGCGGDANQQKKLNLCSSLGEKQTELLTKDFTKNTGIGVRITYLPGGTLAERLDFLRRGQFDCWLGGTSEEYFRADQENMLEPYIAKESFKTPVEMRSRQGQWTSLYLQYIALISNKNNLRSYGLYAPETWDELLVPELKDEIAVPDPALGGASYGMLTSIWQMRGREAALDYAAKLKEQRPAYTASLSDAVDLVYSGRKGVAVVPLDYALQLEERYDHLFATVLKDANRNMLTGAAVMRGGNADGARQFIDYLMSDGSEQVLIKNGFQYMWHVKNYPYNDGRQELIGNVQVPVDDLSWTAGYKQDIIRKWKQAADK